ncbi:MAG: 6-phosphogluconolactonase [Actinomycetota bacterium]|nr:6-phosphogluconolactonase [Actinomycetota bacterium]MCL6093127.1 6-phosphogluconolactonase [Actinomycetota bacterium]MDA8167800.1 6-phosphogluconolactonase [Actinomycetota bacterium]
MSDITIYPDSEHFVDGSADFIAGLAARAVAERGRFAIALSGGSTPRPIYARLATGAYADRIDWTRVHIFFGDERCVPPDDSRSNYRMAREALLDHVPLPSGNIHRIRGEDDPAQAALAYAQEVQRLFRTVSAPAFDLICLGVGGNGHTASLFPGTAALRERVRWVVPQYVEVMTTWRVTFTTVLINAARHIAFFAAGTGKADVLWRVHEGPYQPDVLPSQLIQPDNGQLHWLVDAAAGAKVQPV